MSLLLKLINAMWFRWLTITALTLWLVACGGGGGSSNLNSSPLTISLQPQATATTEFNLVSFAVSASGDGALSYQWRRNGVDIPGATSSTYSIPSPTLANNQDRFLVVVSSSSGASILSQEVTLTVTAAVLQHLVISEISSCYAVNIQCWLELHNPTSAAINLSNFQLKVTSYDRGTSAAYTDQTYALPAIVIDAGGYKVISGNPGGAIQRGTQLIYLANGTVTPSWQADGYVELLDNALRTVDFVRFGQSTQSPNTTGSWDGSAATAIPSNASSYGASLVRPHPISQDTHSAADWTVVNFSTPGGRNDVAPGAVDSDGDGIPDSAEQSGGTFAGLDLFAMGARTNQVDIFVEIDRMASTDPGLLPRQEALQKVTDTFNAQSLGGFPIRLHLDAGNQFSASFNPTLFNLGQTDGVLPYERCISIDDPSTCSANNSSRTWIHAWKTEFSDLRRRPIFHYVVFANSIRADGAASSSGSAEQRGNDVIISLGGWGLNTTTLANTNRLINYQAVTLMHELGHNFGLDHAGASSLPNYKPNYWSVMNYLYQLRGLGANPSGATATQRWVNFYTNDNDWCSALENPVCGDPAQFIINYSNGSGASLDESALQESAHLGRGSTGGAYADWNQSGNLTASAVSVDVNKDGLRTVLTDYNDWANLLIPFSRYPSGSAGVSPLARNRNTILSPMHNDHQPAAIETPPPAAFFQWLSRP